jgi:single-stranded-DNA-specific exonuclease
MEVKKWHIASKIDNTSLEAIITQLLKNRHIQTSKEQKLFFEPTAPMDISLKEYGLDSQMIQKTIDRLKKAKEKKEKVIVFGDYDCDGVCAAAILWEVLHKQEIDVMPFLPNRFSDGYGIKAQSVEKIREKYPNVSIIITVDNGIVASDAVNYCKKNNIDCIITDHHEKGEKVPQAYAIIHTLKTSGAGVVWVLAREVAKAFGNNTQGVEESLQLAAMGIIADQLPLLGVNRSIAKWGLLQLQKTKRVGLVQLFKEAGIDTSSIGTYEVGFIIAPRINAMGRMGDATDALRLLCTNDATRAFALSKLLSETNLKRQKVIEEIIVHATSSIKATDSKITILAHETYHEGIIGLAASRLVELYGKPAIVIAKADVYSKGSARSISGVHITHLLQQTAEFLSEVGGHELAAGFTIKTTQIERFTQKLSELAFELITDDMLTKTLYIDCQLPFSVLTWELSEKLESFSPFGVGNPQPLFVSDNIEVIDARKIGNEGKHLKLKCRQKGTTFDTIAFGMGEQLPNIQNHYLTIAYALETNTWQGSKTLQLKVKDIRYGKKI